MKYTAKTQINQNLDKVIELFINPEFFKHWQKSLISFELIEGTIGLPGAKSRLHVNMNKKDEMEMIETIKERNLPDRMIHVYEAKGVYNEAISSFADNGDNTTTYSVEQVFEFNSIILKLISTLMPNTFKKETQKTLDDFKEFCENYDKYIDIE